MSRHRDTIFTTQELLEAGVSGDDPFLKTANRTGYMRTFLPEFSRKICEMPWTSSDEILEIGGGIGNVARGLIARGARRLTFVDPERKHLDIMMALLRREREQHDDLVLKPVVDQLPALESIQGTFDLIVCAQVLHYLRPAEFEAAVKRFAALLKPGGTILVTVGSPYIQKYGAFGEHYDAAKQNGERWPGYMLDPAVYNPSGVQHHGGFWLFFDPELLAQRMGEVGFRTIESGFEDVESDGRNASAVIATK
jgi:SAM-dependent methyltransferase